MCPTVWGYQPQYLPVSAPLPHGAADCRFHHCNVPTSPPASSPSSQIITVSHTPTQSPPTPPSPYHHTAAQWSQSWPARPGCTSRARDIVRWRGWPQLTIREDGESLWPVMASYCPLWALLAATPHKLIILSFLLTVKTQYLVLSGWYVEVTTLVSGRDQSSWRRWRRRRRRGRREWEQIQPSFAPQLSRWWLQDLLSHQMINILYRSRQLLRLRLPGQHGAVPGLPREYCCHQTWVPRWGRSVELSSPSDWYHCRPLWSVTL